MLPSSTTNNPSEIPPEDRRSWESLPPEILALILAKINIPVEEMVQCVPFVCKAWMETVAGPYCWSEVDLRRWSRRRNDSHTVDLVVEKLLRRNKFSVQRLSAYRLGELGFCFMTQCGSSLKVLEMPMAKITDRVVLKHLKPLPNLTHLDLSHCIYITSKGLAAFGNKCKSLIHFKRNMHPVDADSPTNDSEPKAIANTMPHLQHLELCFGRFGDAGLLEIMIKCKSLVHLDFEGSVNVDFMAQIHV
ncbi:hypothetical protein QVD17_15307 [Tagetes erecta]|uniref:F-box domain-containing protein n=1 Tax=Tagetes erecta TaxID=13708 RepID=A0AAD8NSH6_TARER|nr:hypothetical protein QVD17_15307 [Tagetes erecta]